MAVKSVSITRKHDIRPMGEAERKMRVGLAACYRLIALNGMDDLLATHISARVPGPDEHFLSIPTGCCSVRSQHRIWSRSISMERFFPIAITGSIQLVL